MNSVVITTAATADRQESCAEISLPAEAIRSNPALEPDGEATAWLDDILIERPP